MIAKTQYASLAKQFSALDKNYPQWLQDVETQEVVTAFTRADFFSFEPYYAELNKLCDDDFQFYPELENVVEGYAHIVSIQDGKILFTRYLCAENVYYDSFFFYNDRVKQRCQIYSNGIEKKAIFVEKLIMNDDNRPLGFSRLDGYGFTEQRYHYEAQHCDIKTAYFSTAAELQGEEVIKVEYADNRVSAIHNLSRGETLFDRQQRAQDLPQLLKRCHDQLIENLLAGVEKSNITEADICALLIEYNGQHAFPPSIGFAQKKEQQQNDDEGYGPLDWLNAPDMALFYTCEFFYPDEKGLFDEVNARLAAFDYEAQKQQVFDFYIALCKSLQTSQPLHEALNTTDDFFITACDFEACNHQQFLQALLPEEQWQVFQQQQQAYAQAQQDALDNDEDYQEVVEILAYAQAGWSVYSKQFSQLECNIGYARDQCFSIQPYFIPIEFKKADFDVIDSLSLEPEGDCYYQYHFIDNQVMSIVYYHLGKPIHQTYFDYADDGIEVVKYFADADKAEGKVESFDRFLLQDGKIVSSQACTTMSCRKSEYFYNEACLLTNIHTSEFLYSASDNLKFDTEEWTTSIHYRAEGGNVCVELITNSAVNEDKATVAYGIDDTYVLQEMERLTNVIPTFILDDLKALKNLPQRVCFEKDDQMSFPPKVYYQVGEQWSEQAALYKSLQGCQTLKDSDFTLYVFHENHKEQGSLFSRQQCLHYIDEAFEMLCDKTDKAIQAVFSAPVPVVYKRPQQSFDEIER